MNLANASHVSNSLQVTQFSHSAHLNKKVPGIGLSGEKDSGNADKVTLSAQAQSLAIPEKSPLSPADNSHQYQTNNNQLEEDTPDKSQQRDPKQQNVASGVALTESEQQELEELKRRDAEVKQHEQAHLSAAGNLSRGSASFDYETGPDGQRYAVGGEVNIDTSTVAGDPQATLLKAQKIRRAATAPADPSSQDRSVASEASRMEAQARKEVSQQAMGKQIESVDENTSEVDFFGPKTQQNEKNIQNTYQQIQNTSALEQQKSFVDFFI